MPEQAALPGLAPDPVEGLTERQRVAYDAIVERTRQGGYMAHAELGAVLCARRLRHSSAQTCRFCIQNGKGIGRELRNKRDERGEKLVRWRKGEGWYAPGARAEPEPAGECCGEFPYCGCAA